MVYLSTCFVRGELNKVGLCRCCEGKNCKRTYHLSCLDPPLKSDPPGAWLCTSCIQKKIQSDVHAVFDAIECIWDAKDGISI
jgi:hypothetical protein